MPNQQTNTPPGTAWPPQRMALEVIEMFKTLGLPVCDDDQAIEQKAKSQRDRYLRDKNNPNAQVRERADRWFKNVEALQNRRPELLRVVYEHFVRLADTALASAIEQGFVRLTKQLSDNLIHILNKDCHVDDQSAKLFLDDYLRERKLEIGAYVVAEKPPYFDEFKLPPLPSQETKVWHINQQNDPRLINLFGVGPVWVAGWLAPATPGLERPAGIDLFFNNEPISLTDESLIPKDIFDLAGTLSCISNTQTRLVPDAVPLLKEKASGLVRNEIKQWLDGEIDAQAYEQVIQPMIGSSARLYHLLIEKKDPTLRKLVWLHHKFPTSKGTKTISDLLGVSRSFKVRATFGLNPRHHILGERLGEVVIVDLSNFYARAIFRDLVETEGSRVLFVDDFGFLKTFIEKNDLDYDEIAIKRWFEDFFRRSKDLQGVEVAICHTKGLRGLPAVLVFRLREERDSFSADKADTKELDHSWIHTSSKLCLNAQSRLIHHLKELRQLPQSSELKATIPSLVFRYTASFALEKTFPDIHPEYQQNQWSDLTHHIEIAVRIERESAKRHVDPEEVIKLENKLGETRRKLQIAEGILGMKMSERLLKGLAELREKLKRR